MRFHSRDITKIGLSVALVILVSQLSIPMPYGVPMTLQTLIIPLVALILGKRNGTIVSLLYVLLGMIGLPVFAGFLGGMGVVMGPTGGFILSFPLLAYFSAIGGNKGTKLSLYSGLFIGMTLNLVIGMLYFSLVTGSKLPIAFTVTVLPFLITTFLKIILVVFSFNKLQKTGLYKNHQLNT